MPDVKKGVCLNDMDPNITKIFDKIDKVFTKHTGRPAIITSGRDGRHSLNSLHYQEKAIDLRTKDLTREQLEKILSDLKWELGPDYNVIYERADPEKKKEEHIHLSYFPKGKKKEKVESLTILSP